MPNLPLNKNIYGLLHFFVFSCMLFNPVFSQTNYTATFTSTAVAGTSYGELTGTYTLTAVNPSSGGGGTSNSYVPAGATVNVVFPSGTITTTCTGGTFNGAAIGAMSNSGIVASFSAPVAVSKGASFTVVLVGITNPPVYNSTTVTNLQYMEVGNATGGNNQFTGGSYTLYPYYLRVPWTSTTANTYSQNVAANITLSATNANHANAVVNSGASVTIDFPAGTDATTYISGTFNGAAIGAVTKTALQITFSAPAGIAQNAAFTVVLNGITNPPAGPYITLVMTVVNTVGGNDIFNNSQYITVVPAATNSFQVVYGGTGYDRATTVIQTTDGGYITAGSTTSYGAGMQDAYLLKVASDGAFQWSATYGGTNDENYLSNTNPRSSLRQTSDGGYILAGSSYSFGQGNFDGYLIKTDAAGTVGWSKAYGGAAADEFYSMRITTDGGYIMSGMSNSLGGPWLLKTDAAGSVQWYKGFTGTSAGAGNATAVALTTDGGYVITGTSPSSWSTLSNGDAFLFKADASGTLVWNKVYETTAGILYGYSVQQTTDGGYVVLGRTEGGSLSTNMLLIRADNTGAVLWAKIYGGTNWEWGYEVQQANDGGFILAGTTQSFGYYPNSANSYDALIIKTDPNGIVAWAKIFGGVSSNSTYADRAFSVKQSADGGFVIAGSSAELPAFSNDNAWLLKVDANGNCGCTSWSGSVSSSAVSLTTTIPSVSVVTTGITATNSPATVANFPASTATVICQTTPAVLPVELFSFKGRNEGDDNILQWVTSSEKNSDYFIIEKSRDNEYFETTGEVKAAGNSDSGKNYRFTDKYAFPPDEFPSIAYYRLVQVDYDGNASVSGTVAIEKIQVKFSPSVTVIPNPASDVQDVLLLFRGISPGTVKMVLCDITGREVSSGMTYLSSGNSLKFPAGTDFDRLSPGSYVLRVSAGDGIYYARLIIGG